MKLSELLEVIPMILKLNVLEFNRKFYLQTFGTSMGASFTPSYANIFMGSLKQSMLNSARVTISPTTVPSLPLTFQLYLINILKIMVYFKYIWYIIILPTLCYTWNKQVLHIHIENTCWLQLKMIWCYYKFPNKTNNCTLCWYCV